VLRRRRFIAFLIRFRLRRGLYHLFASPAIWDLPLLFRLLPAWSWVIFCVAHNLSVLHGPFRTTIKIDLSAPDPVDILRLTQFI
jgi:hypothetical protein